MTTILGSTFQRRPCYQYIRSTDHLPSTQAVIEDPDPIVRVKIFNPGGAGTWWLTGYDPESHLATGAAHITGTDIGDFSMDELVAYRGRFGLPLERDLYWTPQRLSEVVS